MESAAELTVERRGRVLLLTIANPAERNAMSPAIYAGGHAAVEGAGRDASIGVIVITGAGGTFSAGGNLNRLQANRRKPREAAADGVNKLHGWIGAIARSPKPVMAAIEGAAAGAGLSLALACDLIVAAEDAKLAVSYVKVGLSPDGGATASLVAALPRQAVMELLVTGALVAPRRLHELGVVNRLCPKGKALDEALAWAESIASLPMEAIARIKKLVGAAARNDLQTQLDAEREAVLDSMYSADCGEGIAAFLEKRKPRFNA